MSLKLSEIDTGFDVPKLDSSQHLHREVKWKNEFKNDIVTRDNHSSQKINLLI
jgi:hypothetical protein